MRQIRLACALAAYGLLLSAPALRAETVSVASIGCDDYDATLMAEQALQDKLSNKDKNALDRITAYRKKAGWNACRPLGQGDQVDILREQGPMVCVHERNEQLGGQDVPTCYWMRRRHIKLPQ